MNLPDGVSRWRIFLFWRDVCDFVSGGEGVGRKEESVWEICMAISVSVLGSRMKTGKFWL